MLYEILSLKNDLISKGVCSSLVQCAKMASVTNYDYRSKTGLVEKILIYISILTPN
jgi:hypothetical protein